MDGSRLSLGDHNQELAHVILRYRRIFPPGDSPSLMSKAERAIKIYDISGILSVIKQQCK